MSKSTTISETQARNSFPRHYDDYLKPGVDGTFAWRNQADGVFDASSEGAIDYVGISDNERQI
jgi:hypothetical protein